MDIYFDNAATTITSQDVIKYCNNKVENLYANPSSLHLKGLAVENEIKKTKDYIAKCLNVTGDEIFFTSGGTESNNLAILGFININAKKNIVTTKAQHSSVVEPVKYLKDKGLNVTYLEFKNGTIDYTELEKSIDENTSFVCLPHVNNETGAILDIKKVGNIIKNKNPKTIFHVDGVQGFGKINTDIESVDMYSFSSHKIHGLKGVGGLYIKKGVHINPMFYGGNQQNKIRPGTENTYGIMSLYKATNDAFLNIDKNHKHVMLLKNKLATITNMIDNCFVNGDIKNSSPYILNISFISIKGEILLNILSEKNIFVATGAACSGKKISENLMQQLSSKEKVSTAIRFSFSKYNTMDEVLYLMDVLKNIFNES